MARGHDVAARRRARGGLPRRTPRDPPPKATVVETPLLFEAGMEDRYDATIAVVADEDVRAERAGARGHAAVDERTARQLPQEEKARARRASQRTGRWRDLERELSAVLVRLGVGARAPPPTPAAAPLRRAARRPLVMRRRAALRLLGRAWAALTGRRDACARRRASTRRCRRSRSRCATRTSSASRRGTRGWTPRSWRP